MLTFSVFNINKTTLFDSFQEVFTQTPSNAPL